MKIPGLLVPLKKHQIHALKWQLEAEKLYKGGLNGHLPGLGKTIQALSLICLDRVLHATSKENRLGTLVIVPACVTVQWYDQVKTKTDLKVFLYYDQWRKELTQYVAANDISIFDFFRRFDVIVTSYSTILLDPFFQRDDVHWFRVILDEAHVLRNVDSSRSKALLQLHSTYRWGLSGTLLMNTPMDLFGPMQFLKLWKSNEKIKFIHDLQSGKVSRHVLESTSNDISSLALPILTTETLYIEFANDWEKEAYKLILMSTRKRVTTSIACGGNKKARGHIFALIMQLRQAANHIALVDAAYEHHISSKFTAVLDLVRKLLKEDSTNKIILFSNFTSVLTKYQLLFDEFNINALVYHGGLNAKQRQSVLNDYQLGNDKTGQEYSVLLASTPCANAGINITEANVVILNDLSYNPKIDEQCIARSHRIGQMRPVHVYRMVVKDSIDERILSIQQKKQHTINKVMTKREDDLTMIKELVA